MRTHANKGSGGGLPGSLQRWISLDSGWANKYGRQSLIVAAAAIGGLFVSSWLFRLGKSAGMGRQLRNQGDSSQRDGDVKVLLKVQKDEAEKGCEKQVSFNVDVGADLVQRTATLSIPQNVEDGFIIRLKGWGGSKTSSGPFGDLLIEILVEDEEADYYVV